MNKEIDKALQADWKDGQIKLSETKSMPQELLAELADESMTAIYVADYETDELLYLNKAAKEVLHVKDAIQTGQKCYECLMHRDTPCPFCHKSMFCEETFRENVIRFPFNGRQYKINSKIITWGVRRVHVHYITDVTKIMDQEKELRTLTDKIPTGIGIFYVYVDERVEQHYLNDGYYQMLGIPEEKRLEYAGFAVLNAVHPDDLENLRNKIRESMEKNIQLNIEIRVRKNGNQYIWVKLCGDIVERTAQKCIYYCVYTDIDELKEKQAEIADLLKESRASEMRFKSIMEHVPGAMIIFEVRNQMLWLRYISDSCKSISGYTAEETYARSSADPLADAHHDSREFFQQHEWEDIQKGTRLSYKYQIVCKDGTYKWVSLNLSPVEEEGKILYFGVLRDLDVEEKTYISKESYYNQMITLMENLDDENLIAKGRYNLNQNKCLYYKKKSEHALILPENITFEDARERMVDTASVEEQGQLIHEMLNRSGLMKAYTEGNTEGTIEYKRNQKNGGYLWSSMKYNLCIDPDSNDVIFFVYTYDITQRVLENNMLNVLGSTEYEILGSIDIKTRYYETHGLGASFEIPKEHAAFRENVYFAYYQAIGKS